MPDSTPTAGSTTAISPSRETQQQRAKQYKRPADTKNDFGGNLGGPIRIPGLYNGKNKSFFFFNWEQWRQTYGGTITSQLPTPAELGADGTDFDFSACLGTTPLGTSPCGETVYPGEIMDPQYDNTTVPCRYAGFGQTVTGTPGNYVVTGAPTNKIPIGRASTVAKNIVTTYLMPLANQEVSGNSAYNYAYRSLGTITNTAYSFRIDQNLGAKNKIWGFLNSRENTDTGGNSNMPVPIQTCCGTVNQLGKLSRAGWDWIITPTLVNSLTVGGNRSNNINKSKASQLGTALGPEAGNHQRIQRRLSSFPVYGEYLPAAGPTGRLDGHRQCGRAQRYCALAARRAQLYVRRRGTVSPVFVGEQNWRHLQRQRRLLPVLAQSDGFRRGLLGTGRQRLRRLPDRRDREQRAT